MITTHLIASLDIVLRVALIPRGLINHGREGTHAWEHLNSFSARGGGDLNKNFPKLQMPGGLPGEGNVEASI